MKALVTGGGGFLGSAIATRLASQGDEVTVLGRHAYPHLASVRSLVVDLRDAKAVEDACAGQDVVFHVGAKAGIWGSRQEYHAINVDGTKHVLAACQRHGVPRLVYTSSPSVTFDGSDACNADENLPYATHFESAYAETKAEAERMVLKANGPALFTTALRPHLIFGPGDNHLIPRVVASARAGRLRQVGDGTNKVDITYIENAVDAHLQASTSPAAAGRAYFISQGDPVNLWQWIRGLLSRLDLRIPSAAIPLGVARTLGACLEAAHSLVPALGEPRMTRFLASQLGTSHYYNISAARRDFGYAPKVSNAEGLDCLVEWLLTRGG